MKNHINDRIIEVDNFFTDDECDYILNEIEKYKNSKNVRYMGDMDIHGVREGKSIFISQIPELNHIDSLIYESIKKNSSRMLPKNSFYLKTMELLNSGIEDVGYEYHHYKPGDVLKQHSDGMLTTFDGRNYGDENIRPINLISMGITLNDSNGGDLYFKNQDRLCKSKKGKAVIWSPDAEWQHETNKSENGRHAIVTWFVLSDFFAIKKDHYYDLKENSQIIELRKNPYWAKGE